jgi:hypothetical protein
MHLDDDAEVCMSCWDSYPAVLKDFTNRLVLTIARLEVDARDELCEIPGTYAAEWARFEREMAKFEREMKKTRLGRALLRFLEWYEGCRGR